MLKSYYLFMVVERSDSPIKFITRSVAFASSSSPQNPAGAQEPPSRLRDLLVCPHLGKQAGRVTALVN